MNTSDLNPQLHRSSSSPPGIFSASFPLIGCLIWSHAFLLMAVSPRKGAEHWSIVLFQAGFATLSLLMLLRAASKPETPFDAKTWQPRLGMALSWSGFLFFLFGNTGYGLHREMVMPYRLACLPLLSVFFLPLDPPDDTLLRPVYRWRSTLFFFLVVAAITLRIVAMWISPAPEIDVFWFTNQGAQGLLEGINPYSRSYHVIDPQSEFLYAYLPGQFLFDLPSVALFSNIRWGQIAAELAGAWFMYRLVMGDGDSSSRRHSAQLMTLLLLFFPQVLRMQEQSWVEFKQIFAILLFVWLLSRYPSRRAPWLALGLLFSLKATTWASGPFLLRLRSFTLASALSIAGVMVLIIGPFLIWDAYALYDDVIRYQATFGLPRSTSLLWLYVLVTGHELTQLNRWVSIVAIPIFLWLWKHSRKSLVSFLIAGAALGMVPVLMRQAFLNYYYYLDGLMLVSLAWILRCQHDRDEGRPEIAI